MRVLVVLWWGGGNVNTTLAFAAKLAGAGHDVTVAGPERLRADVAEGGFAFHLREVSPWSPEASADVVGLAGAFDVVSVDYMLAATIEATTGAGIPTVAFVHTLYREFSALSPADRPVVDRADRALVASLPAFDAPGEDRPNVRYIGAQLEDPGTDAGWRPPPGDAPLVLVSLGTTDMGEGPMLQRVLDAAGELPIRLVATVGEHLRPEAFRAPPNAVVTGFVRHAAVMPHASAFVNHCGLGGVMAALHHRVPMVCMPIDRDQPHNAARVDAVGAGVVLDKDASTREIQAAIGLVLTDPSYGLGVPDDGVVDGVAEVEALLRR